MIAANKNGSQTHLRALRTSTELVRWYTEMYRSGVMMVSPKKVIRVLNDARIGFVLMGTHGLGGWRSKARATQDVDVLIAKKDHARAIRAVQEAFPKLKIDEGQIVTRFRDPATGESRIDLMKPLQKVYQLVFRHTVTVASSKAAPSHRIPDLEMALISKFAAMVSPHRERARKIQDAADFADIVTHNHEKIDSPKLERLAEQVYRGGRSEIASLVDDILAGRAIKI